MLMKIIYRSSSFRNDTFDLTLYYILSRLLSRLLWVFPVIVLGSEGGIYYFKLPRLSEGGIETSKVALNMRFVPTYFLYCSVF